jgi:large subunit ribosomal protein L27
VRFASKKQGGSSSNGRDSNPKFLGIKKYGGEHVRPGAIIARQRGTKWWCGANCGIGVDHTVYSLIAGRVHFTDAHDKHKPGKKVINVVPHEDWPATLAATQARNAAKRSAKKSRDGGVIRVSLKKKRCRTLFTTSWRVSVWALRTTPAAWSFGTSPNARGG